MRITNKQSSQNFVAIDFETATANRNSACAVGIVTVKNGKIIDEFYSLIQPPNNKYLWINIKVHGIQENDTKNAAFFHAVFPEIKKRLRGKTIVAHKEDFDRDILKQSMKYYDIHDAELNLIKWECTLTIYRKKDFKPANLAACCSIMNIELQHHEALSDARACAMLYLKSL